MRIVNYKFLRGKCSEGMAALTAFKASSRAKGEVDRKGQGMAPLWGGLSRTGKEGIPVQPTRKPKRMGEYPPGSEGFGAGEGMDFTPLEMGGLV